MWHDYLTVGYARQGTIASAFAALVVLGLGASAKADISIVISQPVNSHVYSVPETYSTVYSTPGYYVTPGSTVQTLSVTPIGGQYVNPYAYPTHTRPIHGVGTTTPYVGVGVQVPIQVVPSQTLVRPVIVNSPVQNSVLVNPVLINSPVQSGTVIVTPRVVNHPSYLLTPGTAIYPGQVRHPGSFVYPSRGRRQNSISISF